MAWRAKRESGFIGIDAVIFGGMLEYFSNPDFATEAWKPTNFRVNRFSEWHLVDGIPVSRETVMRPSLKAAKASADA